MICSFSLSIWEIKFIISFSNLFDSSSKCLSSSFHLSSLISLLQKAQTFLFSLWRFLPSFTQRFNTASLTNSFILSERPIFRVINYSAFSEKKLKLNARFCNTLIDSFFFSVILSSAFFFCSSSITLKSSFNTTNISFFKFVFIIILVAKFFRLISNSIWIVYCFWFYLVIKIFRSYRMG